MCEPPIGTNGAGRKVGLSVLKADADRVINTCQCHQESESVVLCDVLSGFAFVPPSQSSVTMPRASRTAWSPAGMQLSELPGEFE